MKWEIVYLPEAQKEMKALEGSQRRAVMKSILKVNKNPVSQFEGGYGKALGNKNGENLSGCLKIKLKDSGIRIVYKLVKQDGQMLIVVIGARADNEV